MKYLLLAVLSFGCLADVFAQQGFHLGANGGVNMTFLIDRKLYGDANYEPISTYKPLLGIAAGNRFNDNFGIAAEYNLAWMGQAYKHDDTIPNNRIYLGRLNLFYHQIPLLLTWSGGDYKTRFSFMIGPQWGYRVSAEQHREQDGKWRDVKSSFNPWDFGLLVFAGGDITLAGNLYANVGLRMYYGFRQINSNENIIFESPGHGDALNNAYGGISVGLHYIFRNEQAAKE